MEIYGKKTSELTREELELFVLDMQIYLKLNHPTQYLHELKHFKMVRKTLSDIVIDRLSLALKVGKINFDLLLEGVETLNNKVEESPYSFINSYNGIKEFHKD